MASDCYLCGYRDTSRITDRLRFNNKAEVLKCKKCGLIYLDQDSFIFPKEFYEREYHQTYLTHVEPDLLVPEKYYEKMLSACKPWSDKINELLTGKEVVLDVGCSTGHLITNISQNAKKVFGHELSKKEVLFCREQLGLDVSDIPLEMRFAEETFDYITLIFVLEHIADPISFLRYLGRFLKPSGKFVILVPNANDALMNFYRIRSFAEFYFCIEHLFYYTPSTMRLLFDKVALHGEVQGVQEYPITNHLNWGYRQKPSDVLSARKQVPDIEISSASLQPKWEEFWREVNEKYREFLLGNGFADRIWSVVGQLPRK